MPELEAATDSLRARLATERSLTQKQRELTFANMRIAAHARSLSEEVIERRREAAAALSEAAALKGRTREALTEMRFAKSEMQIAERRLWASLETIEDGFAVFDAETSMIASNQAFLRPFADLDFVGLGTTYGDLVDILAEEGLIDPGEMRLHEWTRWMKARWTAAQIEPVTLRFFNNRFVRLSERRTRDGDMVMLAIDITRQIRHQRDLEEARHRAETASRAKSAFLANMSHEIRTPMNGVLAMADLMAEGPLTEDQRLCLDTIRQSGEALLVIINDVLDYSKIEAQKLSIDMRPVDLEATVSEVVTLLQPTAREKRLSLVLDYDMFLPTAFVGDKGRIRQVLMNLVGNAVKFTQAGHVTVRVVGLPGDEPGMQSLHLTVEDTGIGIAPEQIDHIFGEFNQADQAATREFDGTGLGLAISRRLVELMGGEVWVDSTPGEGSVFGIRLTLPVGEFPAEAPLPGEIAARRVLVCDPDATRRAILEKQVRALGLRAEGQSDPAAARTAGSDTIVFLADAGGPGGTVRAGIGCDGAMAADAAILHFPILRRPLRETLSRLAPVDAAAPPPLRRMRVLCAEDNRTNQLVLRSLLRGLDIDLVMVENGAEMVDLYREAPPDLVFTDISMPQMDGREATRAIRAFETQQGLARVPVVAMTAHASDEDRDQSLRSGIDLQLTKPLKKAQMVEQIAAAAPADARPPVTDAANEAGAPSAA